MVIQNADGVGVKENFDGMDVTDNADGMDVIDNADGMDVIDNADGMDVIDNADGDRQADGMDVIEEVFSIPSPLSSPIPSSPSSVPPFLPPSPSSLYTSLENSITEQSEHPNDDVLNASLYQNASISLVTALLLIMSFSLKHNLTDAAIQDLLQLISYFIPKPNTHVTSLYCFKKFFKFTQPNSSLMYYCKDCKASFEDGLNLECRLCGTPRNSKCYFIYLCIKEQIKNLFSRPGFFHAISHRFNRKGPLDVISDVYDGALYRALSRPEEFLSSACNISFQWNTDGVPLFKSSSYSMWPMYFKINELPQKMRNGLNNKILAGVWFGITKPSINTFLKPLCQVMKEMFIEGVQVHPPELPSPFMCKAIVLMGTCDLPAKLTALNMVGHNGFHACPHCEQPGKTLSLGRGHVHIYPYMCDNPTGPLRTQKSVEMCAKEALRNGEKKNGIHPPGSCLMILPLFNIVDGIGIDYMHCILLNIVRLLVNLWFDSTHHRQPWSCSKKVHAADQRLMSIQPPSTISRKPRSLTERKYWKASEYRAFLFYYSLPVMFNVLPTEYYEHYMLLSHAIFILNSVSITPRGLTKANKLLHRFYYEFPSLYHERYLTLNMHQILHLTETVRNLGPLHTFSCFDHEHANGLLCRMIHSTHRVDLQLTYMFSTFQSMCNLAQNRNFQIEYLEHIIPSSSSMKGGVTALSPACNIVVDSSLAKLFQPFTSISTKSIPKYGRLRIKNNVFHSDTYDRPKKVNDSVISYTIMPCKENFGVISYFTCICFNYYAVVKQLTDIKCIGFVDHVFVCKRNGPLVVVPIECINTKVVFMSFSSDSHFVYFAKLPNDIEND